MIAKSTIRKVVELQQKQISEVNAGVAREALSALPYVTDKPLLIGGMRGSGRTVLLSQLIRGEYPDAYYVDFADPRLAGFGAAEARKLDEMVAESGKGVLIFDNADAMAGWHPYLKEKSAQGSKVIASVSLGALRALGRRAAGAFEGGNSMEGSGAPAVRLSSAGYDESGFITYRLGLLSYTEFLELSHKSETGGEAMVNDFMARGAFPDHIRSRRPEVLLQLYSEIILRDVILRNGIRDTDAVQQLALHLIANSGNFVSANALRAKLGVKAVSSVAANMNLLEQAGLVGFVPLWSENPSARAVNPRKVYAADTALAQILTPSLADKTEKMFEIMLFQYLHSNGAPIYYTLAGGGCDFVVAGEEGQPAKLVQACYSGEHEPLHEKIAGLLAAMAATGLERGTVVTLNANDTLEYEEGLVEIVDADTFLGEEKNFY